MDWFALAFASALLSAGSSLCEKKALFKLDALEFSFIVSTLILILTLPFFFFIDYSAITFQSMWILYIKTLLNSFAFLFVMLVIKNLEISEALPLMILTPAFVAIFAFIFIGDELSSKEVGGIALLIIGTYMLENSGRKNLVYPFKVLVKSKSHFYVLIALLLFTATSIMDRFLVANLKLPVNTFIGFQHIFYALDFLIIYLIKKRKLSIENNIPNNSLIFWLILIAVLTIGYRYTQIVAVTLAPVALIIAIKRISVFFSTVIGGKIFNERNLIQKGIATAIMIAGTILLLK
jgi:drug/metabolite transporter (DMT)-like permease